MSCATIRKPHGRRRSRLPTAATLNSLLPPNATSFERGLEAAVARIGDVAYGDAATLWNPATCPLALLPWLAWSLSVDGWDTGWSEALKRQTVADAIALHRMKGTRASVETVLARLDGLLTLVEWFEANPALDPHTFEVTLPLVTGDGVAAGGKRATAAFAEQIIADVARVKPLREHMTLLQSVVATGAVGVEAVARPALLWRDLANLVSDTDPSWAPLFQTEAGEPLQKDTGEFLDTTP